MKALILSGYGINCEDETLHAFKTVGIKATIVHVNDLIENVNKLNNFQILTLSLFGSSRKSRLYKCLVVITFFFRSRKKDKFNEKNLTFYFFSFPSFFA